MKETNQGNFFIVEIMLNLGYSRKEVEESLSQNKYDDITATYLLLGRRTNEVSLYSRALAMYSRVYYQHQAQHFH